MCFKMVDSSNIALIPGNFGMLYMPQIRLKLKNTHRCFIKKYIITVSHKVKKSAFSYQIKPKSICINTYFN